MAFVDEANETYEDPSEHEDVSEELPSMREEETSSKPIRQVSTVPKSEMPLQERPKFAREEYEKMIFKNDTLRKKYDLRNVDEKKINNIFLRAHIKQLKEKSEQTK